MKFAGPMFVCIRSGRGKGCHVVRKGDFPESERRLEQHDVLGEIARLAHRLGDPRTRKHQAVWRAHTSELIRGTEDADRLADWIFEHRRVPTEEERAAIVKTPSRGAKILKLGRRPS